MTRKNTAATAQPDTRIPHGYLDLPLVTINAYSLMLREGDGFLGDSVSRGGFRETLHSWREIFADMDGRDPLGRRLTRNLGKARLDALLDEKATGKGKRKTSAAAATLNAAIDDYARQLAHVVTRFRDEPSWQGVERVVIGGGFQHSRVGAQAVRRTNELLADAHIPITLQRLHHHPDEGGLIGWVHVAPPELLDRYDALLAVDIGGTNVRCGIVRTHTDHPLDVSRVEVTGRQKWAHADDDDATRREDVVRGIADMLDVLIRKAKKRKISLAPFVGVACPGIVRRDGSIASGTQNLPGRWDGRFHLPRELCQRLPHIDGKTTQVWLHNDAVVQGLSELPFMQGVKRWAVLTIGTGLGNASYTNP